jgi:hypothetical protein
MLHESQWNRPPHFDSRNDAEGFFTTLASSPGITARQVEQAADASTILPGSASGQEIAGDGPAAMHGRVDPGGRGGGSAPGQTLSRIIAIPWPTPMHMVHKA